MDFKTYFQKTILMGFFISYTCISVTMMIIGLLYESNEMFGYEVFLSPLIFSLVATLPSIIFYAKRELSIKEVMIRKIGHLVLLEVLILSILILSKRVSSMELALSLGLSIVIIDLTVNLVLWVNDRKTADDLTRAIKDLHVYKWK